MLLDDRPSTLRDASRAHNLEGCILQATIRLWSIDPITLFRLLTTDWVGFDEIRDTDCGTDCAVHTGSPSTFRLSSKAERCATDILQIMKIDQFARAVGSCHERSVFWRDTMAIVADLDDVEGFLYYGCRIGEHLRRADDFDSGVFKLLDAHYAIHP
ncbi:hypothetical protein KC323_g30 [Hortaea werneckii]|nr:hypothetical protein KC323_g30 [Hortaea werneckii]